MSSPMLKHKIARKRLEARISAEKKKFLQFAADLVGRSLTDFVVHSAYEAATQIIKEHHQIQLSLIDRDLFIKTLLNPPPPSKTLLIMIKKYKRNVLSK